VVWTGWPTCQSCGAAHAALGKKAAAARAVLAKRQCFMLCAGGGWCQGYFNSVAGVRCFLVQHCK
jgi:hypothetical protein